MLGLRGRAFFLSEENILFIKFKFGGVGEKTKRMPLVLQSTAIHEAETFDSPNLHFISEYHDVKQIQLYFSLTFILICFFLAETKMSRFIEISILEWGGGEI